MRSWTQLTATTGRSTMAAATLHGKPSYSRRRHMRSSAQGQSSHQRVSRYSGEVVARHSLAPHPLQNLSRLESFAPHSVQYRTCPGRPAFPVEPSRDAEAGAEFLRITN